MQNTHPWHCYWQGESLGNFIRFIVRINKIIWSIHCTDRITFILDFFIFVIESDLREILRRRCGSFQDFICEMNSQCESHDYKNEYCYCDELNSNQPLVSSSSSSLSESHRSSSTICSSATSSGPREAQYVSHNPLEASNSARELRWPLPSYLK